jgi:uncharacterized protein involved in response to NO
MIYGFGMAVIAGFLLTAVKNWTGMQTLHGLGLLALFTLWALARILFLLGTPFTFFAAIFDIPFMVFLTGALIYPIIKSQQLKKQFGIIGILFFLTIGNIIFYLGVVGFVEQGMYWSIYGGLYLVIGLIILMGRRVIPFFIQAGVGYPVKLSNAKWLDIAIPLLYVAFSIVEIFVGHRHLSALLAAGLCIMISIRLIGWHTIGIWKKPLLWSLFVAFLFIDLGFFLMALSPFIDLPNIRVIHAFSFGGIGVMTLSMMARVTLGHTGRNVQNPPGAMTWAFVALIVGAVVRVILPLMAADHYLIWIAVSQVLWITAFLIFVVVYSSMLIKPRIDGQFG